MNREPIMPRDEWIAIGLAEEGWDAGYADRGRLSHYDVAVIEWVNMGGPETPDMAAPWGVTLAIMGSSYWPLGLFLCHDEARKAVAVLALYGATRISNEVLKSYYGMGGKQKEVGVGAVRLRGNEQLEIARK
jgi:hypothetical protein